MYTEVYSERNNNNFRDKLYGIFQETKVQVTSRLAVECKAIKMR